MKWNSPSALKKLKKWIVVDFKFQVFLFGIPVDMIWYSFFFVLLLWLWLWLRLDLLTTFWKRLKDPLWVTRSDVLQTLTRRIHMHHNMERCVEAELEDRGLVVDFRQGFCEGQVIFTWNIMNKQKVKQIQQIYKGI